MSSDEVLRVAEGHVGGAEQHAEADGQRADDRDGQEDPQHLHGGGRPADEQADDQQDDQLRQEVDQRHEGARHREQLAWQVDLLDQRPVVHERLRGVGEGLRVEVDEDDAREQVDGVVHLVAVQLQEDAHRHEEDGELGGRLHVRPEPAEDGPAVPDLHLLLDEEGEEVAAAVHVEEPRARAGPRELPGLGTRHARHVGGALRTAWGSRGARSGGDQASGIGPDTSVTVSVPGGRRARRRRTAPRASRGAAGGRRVPSRRARARSTRAGERAARMRRCRWAARARDPAPPP